MKRTLRPRPPVRMPSGFDGIRFPPEVILLAVRVTPVRVVLPGPRSASRRAWHRGRSREPVSGNVIGNCLLIARHGMNPTKLR